MPVYSFPYRPRAFFACFPAPCGFHYYRFLTHPVGFACSSPLAGSVFIVFPCPSPIVFPPFFIPSGVALFCFCGFPFVSLPVVACRGAVRYCFPPVPVSSPVSVFGLWGGEAVFVPWRWLAPWRGVAWVGGVVFSFRLAARFLRCVGRGVLVGFFIWNYWEGYSWDGRGGWDDLFAAGRV